VPAGGWSGWRRFVADALAERMAAPGSPEELVFAGPHGGALRVTLFRRRFWLPAAPARAHRMQSGCTARSRRRFDALTCWFMWWA